MRHRSRQFCPSEDHKTYHLPLPKVCSPTAFFQPRGATYPGEFHLIRLSCALRISHPFDALLPSQPAGLISSRSRSWGHPFEAYISSRCRTPSRTSRPPCEFPRRKRRPFTPGFSTPRRTRHRGLGFSQVIVTIASLGFSSSEVSCRPW